MANKKKKTGADLPPAPEWDPDEADDAIPTAITPEAGTPEPVAEPQDSHQPFLVLDELTFMQEICDRLNAFFQHYPNEATHLLGTWLPYQGELIETARSHEEAKLAEAGEMPIVDDEDLGASVGAIFSMILQTQHGTGYWVRPVYREHPRKRNEVILVGFEVASQGDPSDNLD